MELGCAHRGRPGLPGRQPREPRLDPDRQRDRAGETLRQPEQRTRCAHDSHNILAIGVDDETLCRAVNTVIASNGGLAYVDKNITELISLPIAGLMSDVDAWDVAEQFTKLTKLASNDGCSMRSPFMTLSFMALLVIPSLKIGDKGLFNVNTFSPVSLWV